MSSETGIQSEEVQALEELENVTFRERVNISNNLYLQLERCLATISGVDPSVFEANVRGLLGLLPSFKRQEVLRRGKEYNDTYQEFQYETYCNIQVGSIVEPALYDESQPVMRDKVTDEILWSDPNIQSPKLVQITDTDYEKLFFVIVDALEAADLTYNVESKTVERGKVIKTPVSEAVYTNIAKAVADLIVFYRKQSRYKDLTYNNVIECLKLVTPSTPLLEPEGDPWPK